MILSLSHCVSGFFLSRHVRGYKMPLESLSVSHFGMKSVYVPFHCSWYWNQHASGSKLPATEVWERGSVLGRRHSRGDRSHLFYRTWHFRQNVVFEGSRGCERVVWYWCSQPLQEDPSWGQQSLISLSSPSVVHVCVLIIDRTCHAPPHSPHPSSLCVCCPTAGINSHDTAIKRLDCFMDAPVLVWLCCMVL